MSLIDLIGEFGIVTNEMSVTRLASSLTILISAPLWIAATTAASDGLAKNEVSGRDVTYRCAAAVVGQHARDIGRAFSLK